MDISQEVIQSTVQILTPLLPYLLKGGKIVAQKALEEAGKKFTDSSWSLAEKVWGRIKPKADAQPETKAALEKAAQKPEEKRAVLLEAQLEDMFAEDPALAVEIGQILNVKDGIGVGGNVTDANILNDSDQNVLVKENKGTINIFPAPPQEGKPPRKGKKETPAVRLSGEEIKADYLNSVISDCKRARLWLAERNLAYTEVNITRTPGAELQVKRWANGSAITPTFDIDGQIVVDFDAARLKAVLGLEERFIEP